MALITCSECGKEFSDKASACPNCGCPTESCGGSVEEKKADVRVINGKEIDLFSIVKSRGKSKVSAGALLSTKCGLPLKECIKIMEEYYEEIGDRANIGFFQQLINDENRKAEEKASKKAEKLSCPTCKSSNIQISIKAVAEKSKERSEVKKKSIVTRAGNKTGRAAMNMLTLGGWSLTPKKSDYSEIKKGKNEIINKKFAICQDCGKSWEIK